MSSTGPGSLLVFLAFLMLSMLLAGTYFTAYLGLLEAGVEVRKAGEAASEQAIVYLFQHPTNISMVDGSPVVKGETRIVIQNVGSRDISFDRILAISPGGSVVADFKVPGNKGLGVRQWQLYKVQDLGLPERWNNFTIFSSEVSRLVLLSERGRTHGSIWGVPPFLEGIFRATLATTMTTSFFYSYIETTSYQTTYTITIRAKQSRYSLTGEWWESNDGKNWYKVDSVLGRREGHWDYYGFGGFSWHWDCRFSYPPPGSICRSAGCVNRVCSQQVPPAVCFEPHQGYWNPYCSSNPSRYPQLFYSLTVNQQPVLTYDRATLAIFPSILYFKVNESLVVNVGITSYTVSGRTESCGDVWDPNGRYCVNVITEWGREYQFQAIELIDWDTGEVYASVNQTSLTFNINANTIVRFKYVLTSSWSRSWEVVLQPPPPTPDQCQQILNDPNARCKSDWCSCLRQFEPKAWENEECCQPKARSCLSVSVDFCCSGDDQYSCLASQSGRGGRNCVEFTKQEVQQGVTKPLSPVSWSASWSLKQGWVYDRIVQVGDYNPPYCTGGASGNSASGECCIQLDRWGRCTAGNVGPNKYYSTTVVIVFKKT